MSEPEIIGTVVHNKELYYIVVLNAVFNTGYNVYKCIANSDEAVLINDAHRWFTTEQAARDFIEEL